MKYIKYIIKLFIYSILYFVSQPILCLVYRYRHTARKVVYEWMYKTGRVDLFPYPIKYRTNMELLTIDKLVITWFYFWFIWIWLDDNNEYDLIDLEGLKQNKNISYSELEDLIKLCKNKHTGKFNSDYIVISGSDITDEQLICYAIKYQKEINFKYYFLDTLNKNDVFFYNNKYLRVGYVKDNELVNGYPRYRFEFKIGVNV